MQLWHAEQARMVKAARRAAPKTKKCPKCDRRRSIEKFGFRTQHGTDGKPTRTMPQSYCADCRKQTTH